MHGHVGGTMPALLPVAWVVPPTILCLHLGSQAMLQMDSATKWGQANSNSLVFNTFIFMQATPCSSTCMHCIARIKRCKPAQSFLPQAPCSGLHADATVSRPCAVDCLCGVNRRRSSTSSTHARSRMSSTCLRASGSRAPFCTLRSSRWRSRRARDTDSLLLPGWLSCTFAMGSPVQLSSPASHLALQLHYDACRRRLCEPMRKVCRCAAQPWRTLARR